jgi:hypothetical protein
MLMRSGAGAGAAAPALASSSAISKRFGNEARLPAEYK